MWIFMMLIASLFMVIAIQRTRARNSKNKKSLLVTLFKGLAIGFTVICTVAVLVAVVLLYGMRSSKLPGALSMISHNNVDYGHGSSHDKDTSHHKEDSGNISVTALTDGLENEKPDKRYTLVAERVTTSLSSGKTMETWRFTGSEGSDLRVKQNEIIEVKLENKNISDGVTIHWHGYDVPNAMDGVAGMTQDAVMPGESFIYKFRAKDPGTYWFHSHQQSMLQVYKGLFGTLIVEPHEESFPYDEEIIVPLHAWIIDQGMRSAVGTDDTLQRRKIETGKRVRVRLINTDNLPHEFRIEGASFKLIAIDGTYMNEPQEVKGKKLVLAAGGRYDISFTMPSNQVEIQEQGFPISGLKTIILLSNDGNGEATTANKAMETLDLESYGIPQTTPFNIKSTSDRNFTMILDSKFGFYNGKPAYLWTINGEVFPNTPIFVVREGDLVKVYIENRSSEPHPMHLHGHHALVLSKKGKPTTGSPWWTDSLNVLPGETYEIGFVADNPGIWMDHCHNLQHASVGMALHVMYEGVYTPFMIGEDTGNMPE